MAIVAKRTIMTLYSENDGIHSHQVRMVLAEKGVNVEVIEARQPDVLADLASINPYGTVPTLIDRDLVLYEARIIMEYLDERFPHPPLFPVYPVARAETRKMMYRIEHDWYRLLNAIFQDNNADHAREALLANFVGLEPVFADKPWFLSEEFSVLDCVLAPLLWRFPKAGIEIPKTAKAFNAYLERLFAKPSFQASLSDIEKQFWVA